MLRLLFTLALFCVCIFLSTAQPPDVQQPVIAISARRANKTLASTETITLATFAARHANKMPATSAVVDAANRDVDMPSNQVECSDKFLCPDHDRAGQLNHCAIDSDDDRIVDATEAKSVSVDAAGATIPVDTKHDDRADYLERADLLQQLFLPMSTR